MSGGGANRSACGRRTWRRRFSENFAGRLKGLFREFGERNRKNNARERAAFRRKIAGLEEKKDRLFDALAEGLIDDRVALNGKITQLNGDIESLEMRYKSLNLDADQFLMRAGEVVDRLRELPPAFLKAESPKEKAAILREMAEGVRFEGDRAEIEWKEPFALLMRPAVLALGSGPDRKVRKCHAELPSYDDCRTVIEDLALELRMYFALESAG